MTLTHVNKLSATYEAAIHASISRRALAPVLALQSTETGANALRLISCFSAKTALWRKRLPYERRMPRRPFVRLVCSILANAIAIMALTAPTLEAVEKTTTKRTKKSSGPAVTDPVQLGGESASVVQVANLIYAGTKTSECFSDHFLRRAENDSAISTSRRLHSVKLSSQEIYNFPLLIMTGEGEFQLLAEERENLRQFIERGGFLLASAGCSSQEWDRSFRSEMAKVFQNRELQPITSEHLIFHTAYDVSKLEAKHGTPKPLIGISFGTRLGVLYSQDGLNDTSHAQGCCCCGGNEITNAEEINVNILVYSLLQ